VGDLLGDLVDAIAGFVLSGFDFDPLLLAGGGDEAAHAVGLPLNGLHDLGKGGTFSASDHFDDLRALAFGTRGGGLLGDGGLASRLARLACFLRRGGPGLAALGGFLGLGRALLPGGGFLRGGLLGRDVRALFPNGGGCVGGFAIHVDSFSALALRMTIHHSGSPERQVKSERSRMRRWNGDGAES